MRFQPRRIGDDLTLSRERVKSRRFKPRSRRSLKERLRDRRYSDSEETAKNEILSKGIQRDLLYTV